MGASKSPVLELDIQFAADATALPDGADFSGWIRAALNGAAGDRGEPPADGALSLRLVGTEEGASLNESWRHKTGPTNVLAFPGPRPGAGLPTGLPTGQATGQATGMPLEYGDLVICLPVVLREAAEQAKAPGSHLAHLVVHGTLHLLGYTHDDEARAAQMEALEIRVLADLGIANPYVIT